MVYPLCYRPCKKLRKYGRYLRRCRTGSGIMRVRLDESVSRRSQFANEIPVCSFLYKDKRWEALDGLSWDAYKYKRTILPEKITAGTFLGSFWNRERHRVSYIACARAPGSSCFCMSPSVVSNRTRETNRSNLVNTIRTGTKHRIGSIISSIHECHNT